MDWGGLFFKFNGRISRSKYWLAVLVYAGIYVVLAILDLLTDQNAIFQALNGMLSIVLFISGLAVGVKRLHDRNKSGWYLVLFYIIPSGLIVASVVTGTFLEDYAVVAGVLGLAALAVGVWAFVEMGCLRGTDGPNPYGPDPLGATAAPQPQSAA